MSGLLWPPLPKKRRKVAAKRSGAGGDTSKWNVRMLAFIYVFSICVGAAILFEAVNEFERDRRLAWAFKFLILLVSVGATAGRLMP